MVMHWDAWLVWQYMLTKISDSGQNIACTILLSPPLHHRENCKQSQYNFFFFLHSTFHEWMSHLVTEIDRNVTWLWTSSVKSVCFHKAKSSLSTLQWKLMFSVEMSLKKKKVWWFFLLFFSWHYCHHLLPTWWSNEEQNFLSKH